MLRLSTFLFLYLFLYVPLVFPSEGNIFLTKNGVIQPFIYIYESVFPLFLYYCMLLGNFYSHWRFLFIRKFFIAFIFLGEQGEQGEHGVLTPFRGEQKGEQNSSKWNKKGNRGTHLFLAEEQTILLYMIRGE